MDADDATRQADRIEAIAAKLAGLTDELRTTVGQVDDPRARALLETGAEVLAGLHHACVDYAAGTELAWRR